MAHPFRIIDHRSALDQNYVLILTTNSVEKDAVNEFLEDSGRAEVKVDNDGCRFGKIADRFALHLTGTSGSQFDKSIGRIVSRCFAQQGFPRPALVALVGIAWGNPNHIGAGDTLISTEVWALNQAQVHEDGVSRKITRRESSLHPLAPEFFEAIRDDHGSGRIVSGPIASLDVRLSATAERDSIIADHTEIVGGDMEAWDVIPDLNAPWIIIKGISDYGDSAFARGIQLEDLTQVHHACFAG